jgi:hypothetical protein
MATPATSSAQQSTSTATRVVGAKYDSPHGSRSGSAYLYRLESGDWEEDQQLTPRDSDIDEHFGTSVAIDGDLTVGGANGPGIDGTAPGFAAVFEQ